MKDRPRPGRRSPVLAGAAAAMLTGSGGALAQPGTLHDSVERIADAWRGAGALVSIDKTRFLDEDQTLVVALPALPDGRCTTVVLLGTRGLGFHVTSAGQGGQGDSAWRLSSEAGALTMEECGDPLPQRLAVTSDSGRGALETIVARSPKPLPALQAVLPERTGGGVGALNDPGALPALPPQEKRAELAEVRAKREGGTLSPRAVWYSGPDGAGVGEMLLQAGCHVFDLFAAEAGGPRRRRSKIDLDAEMRDSSDDRLLARDRTDAPDARLPVCVGEPTDVGIVFAGAPAGSAVLVSHIAWPLPEHLPAVWGAEARGRMAAALRGRHVPSLPTGAIQLAQGGPGTTGIPLAIEPGGCYLAVLVLLQGGARALGLRVHVAARDVYDDRGPDESSAVVAFCAGQRSTAVAQVDAHGAAMVGWGLAVYRMQTAVWEPLP